MRSTVVRCFEIPIEPLSHFVLHVHDRLTSSVAVAFVGEHHEFREPTVALDRLKHPLGLQGESAWIVVHFAMDQKQGGFDLICMHQG